VTRRDWWLGIAVLVAALVFHAFVPRYTWHYPIAGSRMAVRFDRWGGAPVFVVITPPPKGALEATR
jgi:hypothetical protein